MPACAIGRIIHPQAGHQPSMIWYSPLVPLLSGMLILVIAALMARPGEQPRRLLRARTGLVFMGLLLAVPGYALMTPLGANLLVLIVEYRTRTAEPSPACHQVETAVLLSGGLNRPAESISDFAALTPESLARVFSWRGQVATDGTGCLSWLIARGGPSRISEAEVISSFPSRLDVDREPFWLETAWTNIASTCCRATTRYSVRWPAKARHQAESQSQVKNGSCSVLYLCEAPHSGCRRSTSEASVWLEIIRSGDPSARARTQSRGLLDAPN